MLDEKVEPSFGEIVERVCEPERQVIVRGLIWSGGAVTGGA